MTTLCRSLITAAVLAAAAASAFSQIPWEFKSGMAYMYGGPGKMMAMAMAPGGKDHEMKMKDAKRVPANTMFFMDDGHLYSTPGALDPTGNFHRP